MEEFRIKPCIHTGAADSDRKVTLEDDTLRMCISADFRKLKVEVILHEAPEIDLGPVLLTEGGNLLSAVFGISLPLREVRSAVQVTENAECGVWKEPVAVLVDEFLIFLLCGKLLDSPVECLALFTLS